jgi:hypothetical protein
VCVCVCFFYTPKLKITHYPQCVDKIERSYQGRRKSEWGGMTHSIFPNLNVRTIIPEKPNTKQNK